MPSKACARADVGLCLAAGVTAASAPVLLADTGAAELHANSSLCEDVPRGNPVDLFFASEKVVSEAKCKTFVVELEVASRRRRSLPPRTESDGDLKQGLDHLALGDKQQQQGDPHASPYFASFCEAFTMPRTAWPLLPL